MDILNTNNKLIRKKILSMFGGSLAAMITSAIALMADTILAGAFFGKYAIAAVAIGTPIINIFQSLTQTIINGASIKMNIAAGKGEKKEVQRLFSSALLFAIIRGTLLILVCQFFAGVLVTLWGGSSEVADTAVWYLRGASGCILFGTINLFMSKTLALFGQQKIILRSSLLAVTGNLVFSTLLIKILPDNIAVLGLGAGTWLGGILGALSSYVALRKVGLTVKILNSPLSMDSLFADFPPPATALPTVLYPA